MIFGAADYKAALQAGAMLSFVGIMLFAAFRKGMLSMNWLIGLIMILMLGVVPKKEVIITDHVVPANSSVVADVPLGLALTAATFSHIGDYFTRAFETVFALPNETRYRGNGLLFSSHLLEESTRFEITTPRISANFAEFWKSCVYYDLALGLYSWNDLLRHSDIMTFFGGNTSVTRSFTYEDNGGVKSIVPCRQGLNNQMRADLNNEITQATDIYGVRLVPSEATRNASVAKYAAAMPVAYSYLTGMAISNSRIVSQNALANSLKRGLSNFASEADASAAAQDFALARAEQERRTTYSTMGLLAKRLLPISKSIFEAFIYAVFPIVMLLAMLPIAGKVLLGYLKALFWINMWAPLYAILNFAITYFAQDAASAAVVQTGAGFPTGLTVMTNTGLGNVMRDYSAIAGYLSVSIPMIAWMMVSQSGAMMASLAGRVVQSFDKPVEKGVDEATSGNAKLGNTGFESSSAFQSNTAPKMEKGGMSYGDGAGQGTRIGADGSTYTDLKASSTPLGINMGQMVTNSARDSVSKATSAEQTTSNKLGETNAALRTQIDSAVERLSQGQGSNQSWGQSERHAYAQAKDRTESVMEQFAEKEGVNIATAKAMAAEISAQASLSGRASAGVRGEAGLSTPLGGAKTFASAELTAEMRGAIAAKAGVEERLITSEDFAKVKQAMSSEQYSEALRAEAATLQDSTSSSQMGIQDGRESGLQSALSHQTQAAKEHSAAVKSIETAQKQLERAEQLSAAINAKGDDGLFNWLSGSKGMSNADIQNLIRDANNGDLDSMRVRDQLAREYVDTQLTDYSGRSVDSASEGARITGAGQQSMAGLDSTGAVSAAHNNADGEVSASSNVQGRGAIEQGINRIQQNAMSTDPQNALMTPIANDLQERQEAIQTEFQEQKDNPCDKEYDFHPVSKACKKMSPEEEHEA